MDALQLGPRFIVRAAAATDVGRVRGENEDSYLAEGPVFLVADGMGGHARGAAASAAVVRCFEKLVGQGWVTAEELHEAVGAASAEVGALAGTGSAPGSTLAGVALSEQAGCPCWFAFNVGDSRIYLLRDGQLEQISVDHSFRQELLEQGAAPDSIRIGRNVITRALGAGRPGVPVVDQWLRPAVTGDRVLVCSDGLTTELGDDDLLGVLSAATGPEDAAATLVHAAVSAGGRDNVTVVVVEAVEVVRASGPDVLDDDTLDGRNAIAISLEDTVELTDALADIRGSSDG